MTHEKVIKREDGSRVIIRVDFWMNSTTGPVYNVDVRYCAPGKRTFRDIFSSDDHEYRRLSMGERSAFVYYKQLEYVSVTEIYQVKLELWEKLKPTL